MEMTLREIQVALKYMGPRRNNEFAQQAALHGVKLQTKSAIPKNNTFTEEEQQAADRLIAKRMNSKVK